MKRTKRQKGFSLIELLVVVAIILIIAAIAIPALLQARKSANESAAVGNLRALASAEFTYASRNSQNFGTLANLNSQGYVDNRFSQGGSVAGGFQYNENQNPGGLAGGTPFTVPSGFGLQAVHQGAAADYDFAVGVDGVVRYGPTPAPGKNSGDPVGK